MEAYEPITNPVEPGTGLRPELGADGDIVVLEHWAQSGFANTDLDS